MLSQHHPCMVTAYTWQAMSWYRVHIHNENTDALLLSDQWLNRDLTENNIPLLLSAFNVSAGGKVNLCFPLLPLNRKKGNCWVNCTITPLCHYYIINIALVTKRTGRDLHSEFPKSLSHRGRGRAGCFVPTYSKKRRGRHYFLSEDCVLRLLKWFVIQHKDELQVFFPFLRMLLFVKIKHKVQKNGWDLGYSFGDSVMFGVTPTNLWLLLNRQL